MATIEPDEAFEVLTPDEVAETWDGVTAVDGLYEALWNQVHKYTRPRPEESEEPIYGEDTVKDFWDSFSDEHKVALNELAARHW